MDLFTDLFCNLFRLPNLLGTAKPRLKAFVLRAAPCPTQAQAPENTGDFWNNFGAVTDKDPAQAWRYLNQAQQSPDIFRNKMLVME